jgi:hypothetical protein
LQVPGTGFTAIADFYINRVPAASSDSAMLVDRMEKEIAEYLKSFLI